MKQEPLSDSPPSSKFSDVFGWDSSRLFNQEVPPYPMENAIFVAPVEDLGNNPYKQLEQKADEGNVSFQKYPLFPQDEQNWPINTSGGASYPPPQMTFEKKEKSVKEEEVLAQLFSLSGFMNDDSPFEIPLNNDMLIPVQTPSPTSSSFGELPANNQATLTGSPYQPSSADLSPQQQKHHLEYSPLSSENAYYSNVYNSGTGGASDNTNCIDPLVSVFTNDAMAGMSSPPNNDLYPHVPSNNIEKPANDDLQMILDEILAVENLPLENNGFISQNTDEMLLQKMMAVDEENNEVMNKDEDMHIPYDNFQFPPPSKKRLSESSSCSMDESPPPSIPQSVDHSPTNTLSSPPTPDSSDHEAKPIPKTLPSSQSGKSRGNTVNLFGQKEDEIIDKLLIPKPGSSSKPVTRDKLVTMNVEDFNGLLDQSRLTEIEVAFMKEWRRRGKNKMAAQIARKRKRDELSELQDEIELLRRQKAQLKQQSSSLKMMVNSYKKRAQTAEKRIYHKYSTVHGSVVSQDTHNIHVTDDGKTMLVPRMSSQMLLV